MSLPSLVLPEDVVLVPVLDLPPEIRQKMNCRDDEYALSRPNSRTPTKVVDPQMARLLEEFRKPNTVVQAVINFSAVEEADPEEVLIQAHPLLLELAAAKLLVVEDSEESRETQPTLSPGDTFASYEITALVNLVNDTELYRARTGDGRQVALKVGREGHARAIGPAFHREAEILRNLPENLAPGLIEEGALEDRPYLAMDWIEGREVLERSVELHRRGDSESRQDLLALCCRVLDTYGRLHEAGYLHSDVHPSNIIVTESGEVRLIDFGLSRRHQDASSEHRTPRGGIFFFYEPEYARTHLRRTGSAPSSLEGEQYCLGALCYLILAGTYYLDFGFDREDTMRQIATVPPRSFADCGVDEWPEVETVLFQALAKHPEDRFPSVYALSQALKKAGKTSQRKAGVRPLPEPVSASARFLSDYLSRVRPGGDLFENGYPSPPYSSLNQGATGLAYALYRMACLDDDPDLLSLAEIWLSRAKSRMGSASAFYNPEMELKRELLGENALHHTATGIHVVETLIALAQGDGSQALSGVHSFIQAARVPTDNLDLVMGRTGVLFGCAMLHEVYPLAELADLGNLAASDLWDLTREAATVPDAAVPLNLGIAHGWGGLLYAILRWHRTSGMPLPGDFAVRLRQLGDCAEPAGAGLSWPWVDHRAPTLGPSSSMAGWCNGSGGLVFLWSLASEHFGESLWLELARGAAVDAVNSSLGSANLCCGAAGNAYAMLNLYRRTGDARWLEQAQALREASLLGLPQLQERRDSLYRGELGLALLISEMSRPEEARLPFFEHEGWPQGDMLSQEKR